MDPGGSPELSVKTGCGGKRNQPQSLPQTKQHLLGFGVSRHLEGAASRSISAGALSVTPMAELPRAGCWGAQQEAGNPDRALLPYPLPPPASLSPPSAILPED